MSTPYHSHYIDEDEVDDFWKDFASLIENPVLQEEALQFLCGEIWLCQDFSVMKDEFIDIFGNFLKKVKETGKFTLSLVFKSLNGGIGYYRHITNRELLNKPKVNTDNEDWWHGHEEEELSAFYPWVVLKDYIIIDIDNYYSQLFIGLCDDTIEFF
tara:strand:+ start:298 stop:765 length:468 start_codon:yes stop_codon:yes gene_type:complete